MQPPYEPQYPYSDYPYSEQPYSGYPTTYLPLSPEAPTPPPPLTPGVPHRRGRVLAATAAGLAAGVAVAGIAYAVDHSSTVGGIGSAALQPAANGQGSQPGSNGGSSNGSTRSIGTGQATSSQSVGVVDINTVLGYQNARAAGTGLVLTSSGEILTNNHVIDGATKISVTVVSTGHSYSASVVGTDPTDDIAVLQLSGASGLQTARIGDSSTVTVGEAITGVGNAGGVGGTPSAATGQVIALNQPLTATDGDGQNAERLTGMIEINAPIEAGDSGGPLYDSSGKVIGIDTAAQTDGRSTTAGFAIPINKAITIAGEIESGQASSTIHIGLPGFLGVTVLDAPSGAYIENVVAGGPADNAGLTSGDVVTSVDGTKVTSGTTLKSQLTKHAPGQRVTIGWTDPNGRTHTATITLIAGPAD